ncbi:MAG: protoheme IX farnesyltransferase, partial [Candidatus Thioglobus sp.]
SILPYLVGMSGLIYLVSALILGGIFLGYAININNRPKDVKIAWNTFTYSINYLMLIFLALLVDHYWLITL